MTKLELEGLGPFKEARLDLRPLLILLGRNSVGKSFLVQLINALGNSSPNFNVVLKRVEEELKEPLPKIAEGIFERLRRGGDVNEDLKGILKAHIERLFEGIEGEVKASLEGFFEVRSLRELTYRGKGEGRVKIESDDVLAEFEISGESLRLVGYRPNLKYLNEIEFKVESPGRLRLEYISDEGRVTLLDTHVFNPGELIVNVLTVALFWYVLLSFDYPLFVGFTYYLPDSRAGITRFLLRPYATLYTASTSLPVIERQFISAYDDVLRKDIVELLNDDDLREFLNELGCKSIEVTIRGVTPEVTLNMWSGVPVPLYKAPSGIRESLIVVLALLLPPERSRSSLVTIEEPEAHLHPRAQWVLAKLLAKAINKAEKFIILSTHSDYIVHSINTLILSHRLPEDEVERLGLKKDHVLDPEDVSAYLIKAKEDHAIIEDLGVTENGIPEDEFVKVIDELGGLRESIILRLARHELAK